MKQSTIILRPQSAGQVMVLGCLLALALPRSSPAQDRSPPERLGPSSRRTALVISEIAYAPAPRTDGRELEFVELFNASPATMDLSGCPLTDEPLNDRFRVPPGTGEDHLEAERTEGRVLRFDVDNVPPRG